MNHINQLKCVLALAKHRHFGRAADAVGLTQSALSQNIQRIEALYDVPLFVRDRKGVNLTAYGEVVVTTAQAAMDSLAQGEREIKLLRNLETGHLVIGVDPYLASSLLAPALSSLLQTHPNLRFTLRSGDWSAMEKPLLDDEIDILFGLRPDYPHTDIDITLLDLPNARILCQPAHVLATGQPVLFEQVIRFPIASPTPPDWYVNWARDQMDRFKDTASVAELIILRTDDVAVMKHVARNSHALTAAFPGDIQSELENGELIVLKMAGWPATVQGCIAVRSSRSISPAADMLSTAFHEAVAREFELSARTPGSDC